jgi:Helicase conserved C-terminal domain/SNF2-related domain
MFPTGLEQLLKYAKVKTPLQPHQQRVVDRITAEDQPGLVVAHGLGSGKTLTSIAAQEALGLPSDVIVPAALQANYAKERRKHMTGASPTARIQSMQNLARKGTATTNPLLIVDEAHRARDPGSRTQQALQQSTAKKRMLLTGSPFYNHPADIAPLVNLVANRGILPGDREAFSDRYISNEAVSPGIIRRLMGVKPGERQVLNQKRAPELQKVFNKWVDYHGGSKENFPDVAYQDVPVQMTPEQLKIYDAVLKGGPRWLDYKIKSRLPPSKREAKSLNTFLSGVRQISNTTEPFQTGEAEDPKIQRAFGDLQKTLAENERAKAVVYSNFLGAGIKPYRERLQAARIPFGEFTGHQSQTERDQMVRDYNANKLRALLLSSAGGEGLDLKGTRLMQILEPHWNEEKLHQVEGRGARYMSHADLPPEERKLLVQRYLSTRPRSGLLERAHLKKPGGSVDEYLQQLSNDKSRLIDQFRALMEQQPPVAATR